METNNAGTIFTEAVKLTTRHLFFDAMKKFIEITDNYPDDELADDALYNAGLCNFHMNSFGIAIHIFNDTIARYPEATIHHYDHGNEFGRTAAKCHYSIVNCYLGLGDIEKAQAELPKLESYTDSYVITPIGQQISFRQLAESAIKTYSEIAQNGNNSNH